MSSNPPEHKFVGAFSCAQIELQKARERELATLDEKSTSSGIAEPYARQKLKARTGGGKGTTPVTTACPEPGKEKRDKKKKKKCTGSEYSKVRCLLFCSTCFAMLT